jgi:hypothetical protein
LIAPRWGRTIFNCRASPVYESNAGDVICLVSITLE